MWVVGYDPKDANYVQRRDLSYWPLRHGSPLEDQTAIWVPTTFIPALNDLSVSGDLYLAYLSKDDLSQDQFYLPEDVPGRELSQILNQVSTQDFAIAIEFTYHHNWSSNAIQRLRILYDSVELGIPTVYAIPKSGIALRGTERRGDQNIRQSELKDALTQHCKKLVKNNEPVTLEAIEQYLRESGTEIEVELGDTAENVADPKVPLFCRTMQDSFETPCCTVQYDQVISAVPTDWKVAGCQLTNIFELMEGAMDEIISTGNPPSMGSGIFREHNERDDQVMEGSPPSRRGAQRHTRWDDYHANRAGFPHGSLGILTTPVQRHSKEHNYSLPSPRLGTLHFHPENTSSADSYNSWIESLQTRRDQTRFYNEIEYESLPEPLQARPLIINYKVSAYGGNRDSVERWQNVDERTYSGRFILIDVTCSRSSISADGRPRAMDPSPTNRDYVLAADLPMPSEIMFSQYEQNARYRNYVDFADILVFDDGGFLGKIWWDEGEPVRLF